MATATENSRAIRIKEESAAFLRVHLGTRLMDALLFEVSLTPGESIDTYICDWLDYEIRSMTESRKTYLQYLHDSRCSICGQMTDWQTNRPAMGYETLICQSCHEKAKGERLYGPEYIEFGEYETFPVWKSGEKIFLTQRDAQSTANCQNAEIEERIRFLV